MSVTSALYFYSKRSEKSLKYKQFTDAVKGLSSICVDSAQVRNLLLEDDKYNVRRVPSLLILYSSGQFNLYENQELDAWFAQLYQNILDDDKHPKEEPGQFYDVSKPLTHKPPREVKHMPAPGRPRKKASEQQEETPIDPDQSMEELEVSSESQAKIGAIKTAGVSPSEIARQMQEQREKMDDKDEKNRPFI